MPKSLRMRLLPAGVGAFVLCCSGMTVAQNASALPTRAPAVIAHRGGAALMPENTVPAFDNAVRLGAGILEFDMNMTADDQLVIHHDNTVDATICVADAGSGLTPRPIRLLTLSETQKFDCGSRHAAAYPNQTAVPGTRMPTAEAFFARYGKQNVLLFGETKVPPHSDVPDVRPIKDVDPVKFAAKIAALVERYGASDRFILQSADYRTIDAMHDINPHIRTCLLGPAKYKMDYVELARTHHATCMVLHFNDVDVARVRKLQDAGVIVYSSVADRPADWQRYLQLGMDAIFTNDPAALIAYLKTPAAR